MLKSRRFVATLFVTALLGVGFAAPASAQHQAGDSLVNVQIGDITVLAPVAIAANLCDINVNVLALQAREGGAECDATATSIARPGPGKGNGNGGGHQAGNSLVNVQIGDVLLKLPIALAANVCDVNVNILALQLREGGATCTADADSEAG
jgi:hypothetical protein